MKPGITFDESIMMAKDFYTQNKHVIKALTGNKTIRLSKFNATDFDTVGTDNCGFRGQITINLA